MTDILKAILAIDSNAKCSVYNEDINSIKWTSTPIPKADIEAKMNEIANEPEESQYAQKRRNAYPPIGDQLDMLWHSIDQDPALKTKYFHFYEAIKAIKVKYPKND